jgi:spectrin beta
VSLVIALYNCVEICVVKGDELIEQNNYNSDQIKQKLGGLNDKWRQLEDLVVDKQNYLNNLEMQQQFFADCDECDTWMIERGRLLTSYDQQQHANETTQGLKESNLLNLIKKHKDLHDDFDAYKQCVDNMHEQAARLVATDDGVNDKIQQRLAALDRRYMELMELCRLKKAKLNDMLQICRLNADVDNVSEWIDEKERFLNTLDPQQINDVDELEVIKHRFDGFERDMNTIAPNIGLINQQTRQLLTSEEAHIVDIECPPPSATHDDIHEKVNSLNQKWSQLRKLVDKKRDALQSTLGVQTFVIESNETIRWIEEKIKIVQSTAEFGKDLTGVMNMQRRLSSLERDMAAIESKLVQLEHQGGTIEKDHPEEHARVTDKLAEIKQIWHQFTDILRVREESMGEAAELQKFLRDLDHFSMWLTKTQKQVAADDQPQTLSDAEHLLNQHQNIKEEIDRYAPDYAQMRAYGQHVVQQPEFGQDSQYIFFVERLNALDKGWDELDAMWRQKQLQLSEQLNMKMYERDVKQGEALLNTQEYYLGKQEQPATLDEAEQLIRKHEDFITSVKANEDKIDGIRHFAMRLCEDNHHERDRIKTKADEIDTRFTANKANATRQLDALRDSLEYYQYLQDCDELKEWLDAKYMQAKDDKYRDTKNIHMKWMRHKAFEAEIQANHNRIDELERAANSLANDKSDLRDDIQRRLGELKTNWQDLQVVIKDKGEKLFDANRSLLYDQSVDSIDTWIRELEKHLEKTSTAIQPGDATTPATTEVDLTTTNILLERQREIEAQLVLKQKQVDELKEQAVHLKENEPERSDDIDLKRVTIQERFRSVMQPLEEQRKQLEAQKRVYQFIRDCEDELLWIDEKTQLAQSADYGSSLVNVKMLQRKTDALHVDVDNHATRIQQVCADGEAMVAEEHPRAEEFKQLIGNVQDKWAQLTQSIGDRHARLAQAEQIQQYLFDCSELEAWIGEQELYIMQDEPVKDELGAHVQLKRHEQIETDIDDHSMHIRQLDDMSRRLLVDNQQNDVVADLVAKHQSTVNKHYAGLKQLANDKHLKLDDAIKLYVLKRDIDDLEQWIADKETVANSQELGTDYEHVNLLRDRFEHFKVDTQQVGNERVQFVNDRANLLIDCEHTDAARIAQWKDEINMVWYDLLELIETRMQLLHASWDLHKYFNDCKDCLAQIDEKKQLLVDDVGRDAQSVAQLQRKHVQFEADLLTLGGQVHECREYCQRLLVAYAGDKSDDIRTKESDVIDAWRTLQRLIDIRKRQLADTGDLYKFFNMSRDLAMWMDGIIGEMKNDDKPRDVSGVELLMNNHQSLKAEMDARAENFTICINLGKDLINRKHVRACDVKDRCIQLCLQNDEMVEQWDERWEHLQLMLEVYQFARDASVAEQWLIAQEPYLHNEDLGDTLDQVEHLIKKHEAFEKSISAQEDRFNALKRLTTLELRQQQQSSSSTTKQRVQRRPAYEDEFKTLDEKEADNRLLQAKIEKERLDDELRKNANNKDRDTIDGSRSNEPGTSRSDAANADTASHHEGILTRKHEWESVNRKATSRSWDKYYCVLNGSRFEFYKDQKHFKSHKATGVEINLSGASVEQAVDYKKKEHVFRIRLANGGQYLFRAKDDDEMHLWINKICTALGISVPSSNDMQNKTKSLPIQRNLNTSLNGSHNNNNHGTNTLASTTVIQGVTNSSRSSLKKDNTSSPSSKNKK